MKRLTKYNTLNRNWKKKAKFSQTLHNNHSQDYSFPPVKCGISDRISVSLQTNLSCLPKVPCLDCINRIVYIETFNTSGTGRLSKHSLLLCLLCFMHLCEKVLSFSQGRSFPAFYLCSIWLSCVKTENFSQDCRHYSLGLWPCWHGSSSGYLRTFNMDS